MTRIAWTWDDVQRAQDKSVADPASWKGALGLHLTRGTGGAMMRFTGGGAHFAPRGMAGLKPDHPAVVEGRTVFMKSRRDPEKRATVLVRGHNNGKTGDFITKGSWAGLHIFTLTLEERKTCPRTCELWRECYGNAMPYALRHQHGPALTKKIEQDLTRIAAEQGRFAVRLHILGDFYDEGYAQFWQTMAAKFRGLHVWGYTHHPRSSRIGRRLHWLNTRYPERVALRFSVPPGTPRAPMQATTIWREPEDTVVPEGNVCPVSMSSSVSCGTCGLCWDKSMRDKTIVFPGHGMNGGRKNKDQGRLL